MRQLLFIFTEYNLEYIFDYYIIPKQINGSFNK